MSNRAQSQYLRIYTSGGADHYLWQNYYVNTNVTLSSKVYRYFPFAYEGIAESSILGGATVGLVVPATSLAVSALETAWKSQYLCEVSVYEFDNRYSNSLPQADQTLVASFTGNVISMSGSFTTLQIELGSALAPVGAQIPPRTYTSTLVGAPIRI